MAMSLRVLVVAGLIVGASMLPRAQDKQPVTHEALWLMPRVGAPVPSPDGKWVVVSVTQPAYDDKDQTSDLWLVPASGSEAPRVTSISTGAASPVWRSDGKAILFSSLVYPNAADDAANKKAAAERKDQKYKVRAYDSFPVRYWDRWLDDRQIHVFVQSVDPPGVPKDLLAGTKLVKNPGFSGRRLDSGEELDAVWAPDGSSIIFAATTNRTSAAFETVHVHLYQVPAAGGEPGELTPGKVTYEHPRFRPDGRALYFISSDDDKQVYSLDRLAMLSWPIEKTATPAILSKGFDRSVESWAFSADSQKIYLTAEDAGLEKVYAVSAQGGETTLAVAPARGVYTNLTIASRAAGPVVIADWSSSINPAEIVRLDLVGRNHRALTAFAAERAAALDWQPPEHFWFTSSRGRL